MLEMYRNNDEVAIFIDKLENAEDEVRMTVNHHLAGSKVDGKGLVTALEFLLWGEPRKSILLQCDYTDDFPYVRRCLGVLLGPPSKRIEMTSFYGGTAIVLSTVSMGGIDGVKEEDIFYIGKKTVEELEKDMEGYNEKAEYYPKER